MSGSLARENPLVGGSLLAATPHNPNAGLTTEFAQTPILDRTRVGHLRHIRNLASLPDGDWSFMGIADAGQEATISYRYQLAKMAYALGLTHFHRLPAAPGAFIDDYRNLMRKMMRYDVWSYWEKTSRSSTKVDPGLETLREPWMDPVVKENIMYSGHVQAMAGMYAVLFDDDRYERPGGLTFSYEPLFASGGERFVYDFTRLTDMIYWQMVETGFLGVPCEPNMVFLVCNQFPILGFRFHDVRFGTRIAEEVSRAHFEAWRKKGLLDNDGTFSAIWMVRQDLIVGAHTPWAATIMNAWNRDFVHSLYPRQTRRAFIEAPAGTMLPAPTFGGERYESVDSNFGLTAIWLSEMGDVERLEAVLAYADRFFDPTWYKGGLFYPRNDTLYDDEGHFTGVDPWTGNALIAFSRLNVADGLHFLYRQPWSSAHFARPKLGAVSANTNVLRACYAEDGKALVLTVQTEGEARERSIQLTLSNLTTCESWAIKRDGEAIGAGTGMTIQRRSSGLSIEGTDLVLAISAERPTNLVLSWG